MTKIDLENNIIEFDHQEAIKHAFLLLSYVHQSNKDFKNESPKTFLKNWTESYRDFLRTETPSVKYKEEFDCIKTKNDAKMEQKAKEAEQRFEANLLNIENHLAVLEKVKKNKMIS